MKALVLCSGGADSTTALYWAKAQENINEVVAIFFNYGSKQNKTELQYIKKHTKKIKVQLITIDMRPAFKMFKSALMQNQENIPLSAYNEETNKKLVVPFRNGIFLSAIAGLAESIDCDYIILGNHSGDHALYPDCTADFISAMSSAIYAGTYKKPKILSPFCNLRKDEIIKLGKELNVDYSLTYSCYIGEKIHCGKCPTCIERAEAFIKNNIKDKAIYKGK